MGDVVLAGRSYGRIKAMTDFHGKKVVKARPSTPVLVMGLNDVPDAGELFLTYPSERDAKVVAEERKAKAQEKLAAAPRATLEELFTRFQAGELQELSLIVKADVQGSEEAIRASLSRLVNEEVKVTVISSGVGAVLESDVMLATTTANTAETGVMILAFRIRVESSAKERAESEGIIIKRFSIIYELIDYIDGIMKGMLTPEVVEHVIGSAEVKEVIKIKEIGKIAGCIVTSGYIRKSEKVRIFRDGAQVWDGKISALKRFKDDASEVQEGFECGISLVNYENLKKGDIIECFTSEVKKK